MIVKITALCVAVAMICSALRIQRPEMATALSLAAGLAVLALLAGELGQAARWAEGLGTLWSADADAGASILKGAGIAIVSELGSQLCIDAGETALAGRINLAARVAMLGLCLPMLEETTELIVGALA